MLPPDFDHSTNRPDTPEEKAQNDTSPVGGWVYALVTLVILGVAVAIGSLVL